MLLIPDSDPLAEIRGLADRYRRHLRRKIQARNLTENSARQYVAGVDAFLKWLGQLDIVPANVENITREVCESYADWLCSNRKPATAQSRYDHLGYWLKWLAKESFIAGSPLALVERPGLPEQAAPRVFTDKEVNAQFATCKGKDFQSVRDLAILHIFYTTGVRLNENTTLQYNPGAAFDPNVTPHLDIEAEVVYVMGKGSRKSKGPRWRPVPYFIEPAACEAVERYVDARAAHQKTHRGRSDALWLNTRTGGTLGTEGVERVVERAGELAGLGHVHAHLWRHTRVDRYKRSGMSEGDICRLMGWDSRSMLDRYAKSTAQDTAIENARKIFG